MATYKPSFPRINEGLSAPSDQTVVPVLTPQMRVIGFASIAKTTFTGSETTLTLASGPVPLVSVQLAPIVDTNDVNGTREVQEFMAIMWPENVQYQRPWIGYPELVLADDPHMIDYWGFWSLPVNTIMYRFSKGYYLTALQFNLAPAAVRDDTTPPTPTPPTDGAIRWAVSLDKATVQQTCAFIDFNWVELFKTNQYVIAKGNDGPNPLSISVTEQPSTGEFKASVLKGIGQSIIGQNQVLYDTIRILRLRDPQPGTYTFKFAVTVTNETGAPTYPVTLTLTVV